MKKNNRAASTIRLKKAIYSPKSTGDSKVGRRNLSGFYVNDSPEESSTRPYENYLDDNLNNKPANSTISLSERHEFTKRSREKLVKKAYCLGNGYKYSFEFSPAINFFKLLCVLPRFRTETNRLFV